MKETFLQNLNSFFKENEYEMLSENDKISHLKSRLDTLVEIRDKYSSIITFKLSNGIKYIIPDERFPHDAILLFDEMEKITKLIKKHEELV